jgi:SNF2 family DNA or RNA helicase
VPGSGKTSVVLAVFEYLRSQGQLDSIFVVGPASCFGPWITEYGEVLGEAPRYEILAGGNVEDRRDKYRVSPRNASDLFLTTFQTLHRDWEHVRSLFNLHGIKFLLVFDEAHYIKQIDGAWANAALMVTQNAKMRCVLTGTPFPRNYTDAFNLFDALWPDASPITENQRTEIEVLTQKKDLTTAAEILNQAIGPLFYRVRKQDLGLARQELHPPIQIAMNKYERLIYDSIFGRVEFLSQEEYVRNVEVLARLKRGRLMRLRQSLSYIWLLQTAIEDYKEEILSDSPSLKEIIAHYRELELPAKVTALLSMVERLIAESEKVLIWSNFVLTLRLISEKLRERGYQVGLIYGATPIHKSDVTEELTRQEIIADFVGGPLQVLVANPAACAESISLHKTCSHAVYYDLSYNCAQYLQSLDRIHRVGGSEKKVANYYFLQYQDTIETDILTNLNTKAEAMSNLIDQPYSIYSLDMFGEDEELQAYDRLFAES